MRETIAALKLLKPANPAQQKLFIGAAALLVMLGVALLNLLNNSQSSEEINFNPVPGAVNDNSISDSGEFDSGVIETAKIYVHIVGEVKNPGIYQLAPDARIYDLVFRAGGFTKLADPGSINLARPVKDGEQIFVTDSVGTAPGLTQTGVVNLNSATTAELDALPGIGPTLAQRIVDWRAANGSFIQIDDLRRVSGIGQKLFEQLKSQVGI